MKIKAQLNLTLTPNPFSLIQILKCLTKMVLSNYFIVSF